MRNWMETKICSKCNVEKDISYFYFMKDVGRYRTECKECLSNIEKAKRVVAKLKKLEEKQNTIITSKICKKCNNEKDLNYFATYTINKITRHRNVCNECFIKSMKDHRDNNKDEIK